MRKYDVIGTVAMVISLLCAWFSGSADSIWVTVFFGIISLVSAVVSVSAWYSQGEKDAIETDIFME
jgi:hypothetical protein